MVDQCYFIHLLRWDGLWVVVVNENESMYHTYQTCGFHSAFALEDKRQTDGACGYLTTPSDWIVDNIVGCENKGG